MHSDVGSNTALEPFDDAPCGYLFTKPDGMITRANQTFLGWLGYSQDDLEGQKRFQELLSPPSAIFYETHFAPLLRLQGFVKEIALDMVCVNGESLPVLANSAVQLDAAGTPVAIRTTVFDVRERRKYERELLLERRKTEHLAAVVEHTSDAIITTTPDLRITSWNVGAHSLFGYTAEEAVGRDFRDLMVPASELSHFEEQLGKVRSGHSAHYEVRRRSKAGDLIPVSVTVSPHIDPPNEVVGYSAIMRDISARKRLEKAQLAERDLELANRLAHEINNPLQAILNCLTMLSLERDSNYLPIAEQHLARIAQVVRDLVQLTRNSDPRI